MCSDQVEARTWLVWDVRRSASPQRMRPGTSMAPQRASTALFQWIWALARALHPNMDRTGRKLSSKHLPSCEAP